MHASGTTLRCTQPLHDVVTIRGFPEDSYARMLAGYFLLRCTAVLGKQARPLTKRPGDWPHCAIQPVNHARIGDLHYPKYVADHPLYTCLRSMPSSPTSPHSRGGQHGPGSDDRPASTTGRDQTRLATTNRDQSRRSIPRSRLPAPITGIGTLHPPSHDPGHYHSPARSTILPDPPSHDPGHYHSPPRSTILPDNAVTRTLGGVATSRGLV
jgi:hypothetical protein